MCQVCTYFAYQLEGKAEHDAYFEAVEAARAEVEGPYITQLEAFTAALVEGVAGRPSIEEMRGAAGVLDLTPFYEDMLEDIIPLFADASLSNLKAYLPSRTKASWVEVVAFYLQAYVPALGRLANATFRGLLIAIIEDGMAEGISVAEMGRYVRGHWEGLSRTHAEGIVRTEVVAASNYGNQAGARATGLPMVKRWLSTSDGRTRDTHTAANGQEVALSAHYEVGGHKAMYPADPNLPAEERIRCRCTETYHIVGA